MITMRRACATLLALGLVVPFAWAGETVTEHETYEKRSMKVEPVPPPPADGSAVERTETSRTDSERRDAPAEVERKTTVVPGPVIKEKKTETVTHGDDDDDD
jgi:hypothetical protein